MKKTLWRRFGTLLVMLSMALALAACAQPAEAPAPAPAQEAAPAPPPVDTGAILKEAAVEYFATIPPTNHQIKAPDLKAALDANPGNYYVLDIRKPEDYAKGHIEGAVNAHFYKVGDHMAQLPTDKQIIVACYTGQTAGQTVGVLRMAGFNAIALSGGMNNGWLKEELPVVAS